MAKPQTGRSRSRSSKPAPMKRKPQPKPQPKPVLNEVLNEMAIKMGALADRIDRLEDSKSMLVGAKEPLPKEPVEAMTGQLKIKSRFEEQMFYLRGICVDILGTTEQITNCLLLFFKHNRYNPEAFDEYFKLKSELESAVKEINDTEIIERGIEITGHAMVISRRMTDIFTNQISYK